MKDFEAWKNEIEGALIILKKNNRRAYYGFSLEMTRETANQLRAYFEKNKYSVIIRECPRKLWDIIIEVS